MKNEPNNDILRKEYKNYIKILDKIIKDAKMKYEKNLIQKNSNNPRQLWSIINDTLGAKKKGKKNIDITEIKTDKNEIIKTLS